MSWRVVLRPEVEHDVIESTETVVVACVVHAARHDRHWQRRV